MTNSLKLSVAAEGVENSSQLAFLKAHRCNEGQGYFFGHLDGRAIFSLPVKQYVRLISR